MTCRPATLGRDGAAQRILATDEASCAARCLAYLAADPALDSGGLHQLAAHYVHRWGARELAAALRLAHQQAPLPAPAAALLRDLTAAGVG